MQLSDKVISKLQKYEDDYKSNANKYNSYR